MDQPHKFEQVLTHLHAIEDCIHLIQMMEASGRMEQHTYQQAWFKMEREADALNHSVHLLRLNS